MKDFEVLMAKSNGICDVVSHHIKVRLKIPSKSPFFAPFKNGFNAVLWCS